MRGMRDEGGGMRKSTHHPRPIIHVLAAASLALLASGCANLGYYLQSVQGQMEIWRRERPVQEVIADLSTDQELKDRLLRTMEIREFASRELGLPDNASYRRYAELARPFVVWNVFAATEFSVQPVRWCFPFTGCVSYRGYFSFEDAEQYAAELAQEGHDVYVGGVPAYSTLGYFDDPLLSTFIRYPTAEVARLVFHELAHQVVYVRDDTAFNESFAVAVERAGVRRWLAMNGDSARREQFERNQRIRSEFSGLVLKHRERLEALYGSRIAPSKMRNHKKAIFSDLEADYRALKEQWGGYTGYDWWFSRPPNNAQMASIAVYTQLVPAFEALLKREGGDLARFYTAVKQLAALPREERDRRLRELAPAMTVAR